ncbi:unnamed protein product [Mytilus edulis]|uniref:G-protein coupled receptors family 1 profile domain-containing protein n=1 Tax=Mytilus edulis TaxID=6550 RepID=A0A8S3RKA9_MYTED|nr:unnamed protein product [Mytilus edulis]
MIILRKTGTLGVNEELIYGNKNLVGSSTVQTSNPNLTDQLLGYVLQGILISNKSMVSVNDYNEFPQDRYSDILLCHTVLVVIGTVIGVLGNSVTIVFYSCRIKERGERYFIPLLAIVDLIACLTISTKYGISGTKTSEDVFRNHTINTTSCSLSTAGTKSTTIYFGLLALIILCNLVITTVLCIPVLKRIQTSFPNNSGTKSLDNKQEQNISSQEVLEISSKKTSGIEVLSVIKTTANSKLSGNSDTLNIVSNQELAYGSNRNKGPLTYALQKSSTTDNSSPEQEENEESLNESTQSKSSSVKGRIRTMFLVIITFYVISYIPTLVCVILRYTIGSFNLKTSSRVSLSSVVCYKLVQTGINPVANMSTIHSEDNELGRR